MGSDKRVETLPAQPPEKQMHYGKAILILLIGTACLAFSGIWVKGANFEPATSVVLRCWIPMVLFIPFAIREIKNKGAINKAGIFWSVLAGVIIGIDFTAWNYAIFYVGAGIASVLLNLQVIILPLLAFFIDKERIAKSYWVLLPIMGFGIAMVGGVFDAASDEGPDQIYGVPTAVLGTLLGVLSGICYGCYLYMSRKATRVNPGKYVQPIAIVSFVMGLTPCVFMLIRGEGFDLSHGVLIDGQLPAAPETMVGDAITGANWFQMILLAVLGQFIAWTFVQIGSVNMDPTVSAGLLLLSPVSTIFIAAAVYSEIPTVMQIIGVVLVLGAVAYQNGLFELFLGKKPSEQKDVHPKEDVFDEKQDDPMHLKHSSGGSTPVS